MKEGIKKHINFLLFSNLYVALPVASISLITYYLFDLEINLKVILFIYFSTLFVYNTHRIVGLSQIESPHLSERHSWAKENRWCLYFLIIFSGLGAFACALFLGVKFIGFILAPSLISAGYSIPVFRRKGRYWRLRDIPFAKVFFISFTVSFVSVYIPIYVHTDLLYQPELFYYFLSRCFFIFAITIPFDIRDLEFDKLSNINTAPMIFGIAKAKQISLLSLACYAFIVMLLFSESIYLNVAHLAAAIFAGWVITLCKKNSSEYYYSLLVEGTMLVLFILVWLATQMG